MKKNYEQLWKRLGTKIKNIQEELPINQLYTCTLMQEIINDIYEFLELAEEDAYKLPIPIEEIAKQLGFIHTITELEEKEFSFNPKMMSLKYYKDTTTQPYLIKYKSCNLFEKRFAIAYEICNFLQEFAEDSYRIEHTYFLMQQTTTPEKDFLNNLFAFFLLLPKKELEKNIEQLRTQMEDHHEITPSIELFWSNLSTLAEIPLDKTIIGYEYIKLLTPIFELKRERKKSK